MKSGQIIIRCLLFISILSILIPISVCLAKPTDSNDLLIEENTPHVLETDSPSGSVYGSVNIDVNETTIPMSPREDGIGTVYGDVDVGIIGPGQSFQRITINLRATAEGLSTSIDPVSITIDPKTQSKVPFTVTVSVPESASTSDEYQLEVAGTATVNPGFQSTELTPDQANILIGQYYDLVMEQRNFNCTVESGRSKCLEISIQNLGNGEEAITFELNREQEWSKMGIHLEIQSKSTVISEKSAITIPFNISLGDEATDGEQKLKFTIHSTGSMEKEAYPLVFFVNLRIPETGLLSEVKENYMVILISVVIIAVVIVAYIKKKKGASDRFRSSN